SRQLEIFTGGAIFRSDSWIDLPESHSCIMGRPEWPSERPISSLRPWKSMAYDASSIEVLTGLEPVRKRPGMYTFTDRPDHLPQEVMDNAADEAIAGYCTEITATLQEDGSLSVADNGRGMPVDLHKGEKIPGVEVILTRLHSGAKFSDKSYRFSGGLH